MTLELFFVAGSFVVGVGQVVEAWVVRRNGDQLIGPMAVFLGVEFSWAVFAWYVAATSRLEYSHWLALMFVAYIPLSIAIGFLADPKVLTRESEEMRVPKAASLFGAVFGASFAAAALYLLAA